MCAHTYKLTARARLMERERLTERHMGLGFEYVNQTRVSAGSHRC